METKHKTIYDFVSKSSYFGSGTKKYAAKQATAKVMSKDQTDVIHLIIGRGLHTIHPFVDMCVSLPGIREYSKLKKLKRGDVVHLCDESDTSFFFYRQQKYQYYNKIVYGDIYGYTKKPTTSTKQAN